MIATERRPSGRQTGQALVLTIAFSFVCAIMVFYLFGTAQLANQKTKLQNTADAAAFSAGVLQARDYNFSAYTNRAMVANHVAMAQFVGLDSWTEEVVAEFKPDSCIAIELSKCWFAFTASFGGPMWNTPQGLAYKAAQLTRKAFNVEKPVAKALEPLIFALQKAQTAYHLASMTQFGASAVDGVVKANDPDATVSRAAFNDAVVVKEIVDWRNFTKTMPKAQYNRFANVTVDSAGKDGFSHDRNTFARITPSLISTIKPFLCPGIFSLILMKQNHGGGTQMSKDMARWFALDSANVSGTYVCVIDVFPPLGYGGTITSLYMDAFAAGGSMAGASAKYAATGYSTPTTSSYGYGGLSGAMTNPAGLVRYVKGPGNNVAPNYKGMRDYQDVAGYAKTPTNQMDAANFAPPLSIEVQKDKSKIRTADQILPGNDLLKMNDALKGDVMRVVATSQTYFMRPHRADHQLRLNASYRRDGDNKTEYASLFNPYWQARLVATPRLNVELSTTSQ